MKTKQKDEKKIIAYALVSSLIAGFILFVYADALFSVNLNSPVNASASNQTPAFSFTVSGSEPCYNCTLFIGRCSSSFYSLYSCNMTGSCNHTVTNCSLACYNSTYTSSECQDPFGCTGTGTDCAAYCYDANHPYAGCTSGSGCYGSGAACPTCKGCVNGSACQNEDAGQDLFDQCTTAAPPAAGSCKAGTCDGSGSCSYLAAGENSQPACKRCSGSSFDPVNVSDNTQDSEGSNTCSGTCKKCSGGSCVDQGDAEDLFSQCEASYMSCSSICVKQGGDGYCDGSGACDTNDATSNCDSNYYCSSGSCTSGACDSNWHCSGNSNCQYTCNGAGSCNADYNCDSCSDCSCSCGGYNTAETIANGNCGDGKDNDCDGYADANDAGCEDCTCGSSDNSYSVLSIQGQTVYLQCTTSSGQADKCWTPGSASTYSWGPIGTSISKCTNQSSSYPACNYCDTLSYAGWDDWGLPDIVPLVTLFRNTNICDASAQTCFGVSGSYYQTWTCDGVDTNYATMKSVQYPDNSYSRAKTNAYYINCVRFGGVS